MSTFLQEVKENRVITFRDEDTPSATTSPAYSFADLRISALKITRRAARGVVSEVSRSLTINLVEESITLFDHQLTSECTFEHELETVIIPEPPIVPRTCDSTDTGRTIRRGVENSTTEGWESRILFLIYDSFEGNRA